MRKLMTSAGLAVALLAGPAYAASETQTPTTGSDAARTGSAATSGSATGGGSAASEGSAATSTQAGASESASPSTSDTGADAARTGSAAAPGSATGGGSAESGTSSTTTMGSTPGTTGAASAERTFTTGELHELIGQDVQNAGGEEIGEINDVVMVDGRPVLVVGVGGFLGLGAKEVTIPYDEATMSSDGVQVNMTEDQLKQQPEYNSEATAGVSIKDTYKQ